jgi:hypothetical protein
MRWPCFSPRGSAGHNCGRAPCEPSPLRLRTRKRRRSALSPGATHEIAPGSSEAVREAGMGSPGRPHAGRGKTAKALFCLASGRLARHLRSAYLTLFAHPLNTSLFGPLIMPVNSWISIGRSVLTEKLPALRPTYRQGHPQTAVC